VYPWYGPVSGNEPYLGPPYVTGRSRLRAILEEPFSPLLSTMVVVAALALVALALLVGLGVTQGDWGSGAVAAASTSLLVAVCFLVGTLVRAGLGQRTRAIILLGLAAVLVFGAAGGTGLALANPLRLRQARTLEAQHAWSAALHAYTLAGEYGPANHDLARVNDEWGEDLAGQHLYPSAVAKFQTVIATYPGATAELHRAVQDLFQAYGPWLDAGSSDVPFGQIAGDLDSVRKASWCDTQCQASAASLGAKAHYLYGKLLSDQLQYTAAIAQFDDVRTQFPTSVYATQAYSAEAATYYALGQAQLSSASTCPDAVPIYQQLAHDFPNTPEGGTAKAALAAPVSVTGVMSGFPTNPTPTMYLSKTVFGSAGYYQFSEDYSAKLDGSGHFTFTRVPQGKYNLSALRPDGSGEYWDDQGNLYTIVVGPLCTLDLSNQYTWK
jgi:tetratricopeptide (TPR) repeat protein